jgi:hypothetical protein
MQSETPSIQPAHHPVRPPAASRLGRLAGGASALVLALAMLSSSSQPAAAQEFRLHVEPAVAFWLDTPQSDRVTTGFYFALRPGLSLGRMVDLQWS